MIQDTGALQKVQAEWATARSTFQTIKTNIVWAFAGGGYTSREFHNIAYSLTLLFGFSVLENVLRQIRDEGMFTCKSNFVGALMDASQTNLNWIDYPLVDQARDRRNDVAHRQVTIDAKECERYLDAIESELRGWGIV